MKFEVEVEDAKIKTFLTELVENLPEYSISLACIGWDYDECRFTFKDEEDDDNALHTICYEDIERGFKILVDGILQGKHNIGITVVDILCFDGADWDAEGVDCLIQCSIFGEIVYG